MISFLRRLFRYVISRIWDLLNPRAIMWRHIKKQSPNKAIITGLGKDLKVRIYTHDIIGRDIYVKGMFEKAQNLVAIKSR